LARLNKELEKRPKHDELGLWMQLRWKGEKPPTTKKVKAHDIVSNINEIVLSSLTVWD